MSDIKRMDIKEFREFGYLQEVNRRFLHPLGLALEVKINDETGKETLGGIWDYRDDPEGMVFGPLDINAARKAMAVLSQEIGRSFVRKELMGATIQPLNWAGSDSTEWVLEQQSDTEEE